MRIEIPGKPIHSPDEAESGPFSMECREQVTGKFTGPLFVQFRFEIPRPKSHYGTGKNDGVLKKSAPEHAHCQRQDFDDLVKFACDCLNGLAWVDDMQIVESHIKKIWADRQEDAKTVIWITEMMEGEPP